MLLFLMLGDLLQWAKKAVALLCGVPFRRPDTSWGRCKWLSRAWSLSEASWRQPAVGVYCCFPVLKWCPISPPHQCSSVDGKLVYVQHVHSVIYILPIVRTLILLFSQRFSEPTFGLQPIFPEIPEQTTAVITEQKNESWFSNIMFIICYRM